MRLPGYYAGERPAITPKSAGVKSFDKTRTSVRRATGSGITFFVKHLISRSNLSDVHCALIQFSDPVNLTDTSEKESWKGFPSDVPR